MDGQQELRPRKRWPPGWEERRPLARVGRGRVVAAGEADTDGEAVAVKPGRGLDQATDRRGEDDTAQIGRAHV